MADDTPTALESRGTGEDGRLYSPSVARNRDPIRDVFATIVTSPIRLLEIASGTGEHGAFMTSQFPGLDWTYSDIDPGSRASQFAWCCADKTGRLNGPYSIDASADHWGDAESCAPWDVIFSANMVHIASRSAVDGLLRGAARLLAPRGKLILYGPFARAGEIAPSNAAFNENLKSRNAEWGVRDLDGDILPLARDAGLVIQGVTDMPANNLIVIFGKLA